MSRNDKGVLEAVINKAKVEFSACGPLCEAFQRSPTHCWRWCLLHEFFKTCYFFGRHVRCIRLIPKKLRVNIIDKVFFTVTCFVRELCLFWHVLPFSAHVTLFMEKYFLPALCCGLRHVHLTVLALSLPESCPRIMSGTPKLLCIDKLY